MRVDIQPLGKRNNFLLSERLNINPHQPCGATETYAALLRHKLMPLNLVL